MKIRKDKEDVVIEKGKEHGWSMEHEAWSMEHRSGIE